MEKIIQIIQAPSDLQFIYTGENNSYCNERVVCLALVEDEKGERRVKPITLGGSCFDDTTFDVYWELGFVDRR